jgi:hypothetical protein
MTLAFKKVKVYTKLTLFLIVAVAIGAVLIKNRSHSVQVWFFGLVDPETKVNVVWLMLWTALGAVVSWWVLGLTIGLIKDARKLRCESEFQQRERAQQERAARLDEREKRIDEKINQAIAQEPGSDEE